jgi:hypothetical protein
MTFNIAQLILPRAAYETPPARGAAIAPEKRSGSRVRRAADCPQDAHRHGVLGPARLCCSKMVGDEQAESGGGVGVSLRAALDARRGQSDARCARRRAPSRRTRRRCGRPRRRWQRAGRICARSLLAGADAHRDGRKVEERKQRESEIIFFLFFFSSQALKALIATISLWPPTSTSFLSCTASFLVCSSIAIVGEPYPDFIFGGERSWACESRRPAPVEADETAPARGNLRLAHNAVALRG